MSDNVNSVQTNHKTKSPGPSKQLILNRVNNCSKWTLRIIIWSMWSVNFLKEK